MLTGITAAFAVSFSVALAELLLLALSATFTAKLSVVGLAGVPLNKPAALNENPATGAVNVHV
jgi:hypothetical protein